MPMPGDAGTSARMRHSDGLEYIHSPRWTELATSVSRERADVPSAPQILGNRLEQVRALSDKLVHAQTLGAGFCEG